MRNFCRKHRVYKRPEDILLINKARISENNSTSDIMDAGFKTTAECITAFDQLKMSKDCRYLVFKVVGSEVLPFSSSSIYSHFFFLGCPRNYRP